MSIVPCLHPWQSHQHLSRCYAMLSLGYILTTGKEGGRFKTWTGMGCRFVPVSRVLPEERFLFRPLTNAPGFHRAVARYGCVLTHLTSQHFTQQECTTHDSLQRIFTFCVRDHQHGATTGPSCCIPAL